MKRLWAAIKSFWDRLQVGESAALVGLSEFGGHYMLPPDRRLEEPQRAPFRPDIFRVRPLGTLAHIHEELQRQGAEKHVDIDRWADDGGRCA